MADKPALSFGVKTSQAGLSYDDVLRVWREADAVPEFEHAWLWDHLVPLVLACAGMPSVRWLADAIVRAILR